VQAEALRYEVPLHVLIALSAPPPAEEGEGYISS